MDAIVYFRSRLRSVNDCETLCESLAVHNDLCAGMLCADSSEGTWLALVGLRLMKDEDKTDSICNLEDLRVAVMIRSRQRAWCT